MKTTARATKRPERVRKPNSAMDGPHATTSQPATCEPLEVMLEVMREHWAEGQWDQAVAIAKLAAPCVHPRLASIQLKVSPIDVTKLTDEELEFLHRVCRRGI